MTAIQEVPKVTPNVTSPTISKPRKRSRLPLGDFAGSAVGKKWIMAVTGVMLMGFVFIHMVGNLKMYLGAHDFNHYAEFLRELLVPILPRTVTLWLLRIGLIAAGIGHIWAAYSLTITNRKARPVKYESPRDYIAVSWAARTMRWSGVIILIFLVWHLADLTWGLHTVNPEFVRGAAYENVAYSLGRPFVAGIYIVGNIALGIHLYHGGWSLFQTVGSMSPRFNPRFNPLRRGFAIGFAVLVAGINISFPIAALAGVVSTGGH